VKKIAVLAIVILLSTSIVLVAKPPMPGEWQLLRKGDPLDVVKSSVPDLQRYDETMFTSQREVDHFGIVFSWTTYVHFDRTGKLVSMNGRSRNDWSGLLDSHFEL